MFTTGQWIFAAVFLVAFVIAAYFAYGKDKELHKQVYKGNYVVLLGFIGFFVLLFLLKMLLKH